MTDLNFETFLDAYHMEFTEYLSRSAAAIHSDEDYQKLAAQIQELFRQYPRMAEVMDNAVPCSLTEKESAALIQALNIRNQISFMEAAQAYYKGCADCIGYLRKMDMLRQP